MRGLALVLSTMALVLAALNPSIPLLAGRENHNRSESSASEGMTGMGWETLPVNQTAGHDGRIVRVVSVQRPADSQDRTIVVNLVVENQTPQEWLLAPRAFALQDRTHTITYPAQFTDPRFPIQYLKEDSLRAGETRRGAVLFRAPSSNGLDFVLGLYGEGTASYVPLIP